MQIFNQFGFNWYLFLAQIVNFLILLYLFKRFLYKPVLKNLKDREKKIEQGIHDAEEATKAREQAETERNAIIKKASTEAQEILAETKKTAEALRAEILEKSRVDADRIMEQAKRQANTELDNMRKQATGLSLELSKKILDNVIGQLFSKQEKDDLVKRGIREIEKYE